MVSEQLSTGAETACGVSGKSGERTGSGSASTSRVTVPCSSVLRRKESRHTQKPTWLQRNTDGGASLQPCRDKLEEGLSVSPLPAYQESLEVFPVYTGYGSTMQLNLEGWQTGRGMTIGSSCRRSRMFVGGQSGEACQRKMLSKEEIRSSRGCCLPHSGVW